MAVTALHSQTTSSAPLAGPSVPLATPTPPAQPTPVFSAAAQSLSRASTLPEPLWLQQLKMDGQTRKAEGSFMGVWNQMQSRLMLKNILQKAEVVQTNLAQPTPAPVPTSVPVPAPAPKPEPQPVPAAVAPEPKPTTPPVNPEPKPAVPVKPKPQPVPSAVASEPKVAAPESKAAPKSEPEPQPYPAAVASAADSVPEAALRPSAKPQLVPSTAPLPEMSNAEVESYLDLLAKYPDLADKNVSTPEKRAAMKAELLRKNPGTMRYVMAEFERRGKIADQQKKETLAGSAAGAGAPRKIKPLKKSMF